MVAEIARLAVAKWSIYSTVLSNLFARRAKYKHFTSDSLLQKSMLGKISKLSQNCFNTFMCSSYERPCDTKILLLESVVFILVGRIANDYLIKFQRILNSLEL
jgi:hypothetical protein